MDSAHMMMPNAPATGEIAARFPLVLARAPQALTQPPFWTAHGEIFFVHREEHTRRMASGETLVIGFVPTPWTITVPAKQ